MCSGSCSQELSVALDIYTHLNEKNRSRGPELIGANLCPALPKLVIELCQSLLLSSASLLSSSASFLLASFKSLLLSSGTDLAIELCLKLHCWDMQLPQMYVSAKFGVAMFIS